ncbi:hypothetical protein AALP_AAs59333U000100 [Arabis alpina]|uniref:Uncharacterized protein n=1 Tax=Arabis alpina TaxID=50452 RepID=A0A087FYQ0_ARAAL|nr:hypothetical protein AALP_AAs59333U000100 [Arabis alpina]
MRVSLFGSRKGSSPPVWSSKDKNPLVRSPSFVPSMLSL